MNKSHTGRLLSLTCHNLLQHEEKFVDAAISRKDEEISRDRYRIPA